MSFSIRYIVTCDSCGAVSEQEELTQGSDPGTLRYCARRVELGGSANDYCPSCWERRVAEKGKEIAVRRKEIR